MNLSHIINEFSFGPYFPDITQPLDYTFELARDRKSRSPNLSLLFYSLNPSQNSIHGIPILPPRSSNNIHRPPLCTTPHKPVQRHALYSRARAR